MVRSFARRRAFPIIAWAYLAALGIQVFFAGLYVFVGASNIELHRNMAHVIGLAQVMLFLAALVGRVAELRAIGVIFGLLVVQGMLVHVGQWFGWWTIAALHPVNALVLTFAVYQLAKRSTAVWTEPAADGDVLARPSTASSTPPAPEPASA
ncbi:MAG TPA: hypothetical protein VLA76_07205 [Candidatus Angelobacter sp.]|nr:hypothetical protein [Candidatus Angelobacter sp.]